MLEGDTIDTINLTVQTVPKLYSFTGIKTKACNRHSHCHCHSHSHSHCHSHSHSHCHIQFTDANS